jgi:hypothetical protein
MWGLVELSVIQALKGHKGILALKALQDLAVLDQQERRET